MTGKHLLSGLIFILALAGCARSVMPGPVETPAPSPLVSPLMAPEVYITYQRSGGFAGTDDTWTIDSKGTVTHHGAASGIPKSLTPAQMAELTAAIRTANFMALKDSYLPPNTCCDRFEYTITISANGQFKTVHTIDASPTAPPELTQLIDALTRLVTTPAPASQ